MVKKAKKSKKKFSSNQTRPRSKKQLMNLGGIEPPSIHDLKPG